MYLTTEQSLADIAEFISYAKRVYDPSSNAKVVTFGGSYAGSLSAWMRMKYPHIVHTAVSSSGPLLAKLNFRGKNPTIGYCCIYFNRVEYTLRNR